MKKRMIIMLIALGILFGAIFAYKTFQGFMMKRYFAAQRNPIVTVSAMNVRYEDWQPTLRATGSVRAIKGVNVTTELAGMVKAIYFTPGATVMQGTLLVQLNADAEIGQLRALEATARLAEITLKRDTAQFAARAVSKQVVDTDTENLRSALAQVEQQAAIVAKKSLRAPFSGRLGINNINPGQYLNVGDAVVTLQSLDPIYVDFTVPQQELVKLSVGQAVSVFVDSFPGVTFEGKITTINPILSFNTRNVTVEATFPNPQLKLIPGMFATVYVKKGPPVRYLTLPQTAVAFNPYGDIVYILTEGKDEQGNKELIAKQVFVTTGDRRGDQIAILEGLKAGDLVVTTGQVKLKNGSRVRIDNSVVPLNEPAAKVSDEGFDGKDQDHEQTSKLTNEELSKRAAGGYPESSNRANAPNSEFNDKEHKPAAKGANKEFYGKG